MLYRGLTSGRLFTPDASGISGGEGTVYPVREDTSVVIKVYHEKVRQPDRFDKLRLMIRQPPDDPGRRSGHNAIAWPIEIIRDQRGTEVGFVMPRVDGAEEFASVYHPATRQRKMPDFTYLYLLRCVRNLSAAVAAIHDIGVVFGDFNVKNVLVHPTALVTLIDCDSFQIGNFFSERVCAEYVPPEWQGRPSGQRKDDSNDHFALAVFIYLALMHGVHPYAGRGGGPAALGERINQGLYANAPSGQPPAHALPVTVLPNDIVEFFNRAFIQGHKFPDKRPSGTEWCALLGRAESDLVTCSQFPAHFYFRHNQECPWCRRINQGKKQPRQKPLHSPPKTKQQPVKVSSSQAKSYWWVLLPLAIGIIWLFRNDISSWFDRSVALPAKPSVPEINYPATDRWQPLSDVGGHTTPRETGTDLYESILGEPLDKPESTMNRQNKTDATEPSETDWRNLYIEIMQDN